MNDIREQLKSYLDGELPPQQARQVERAMEQDPALRQEFEELRRISATLREASIAPKVVGLESTLQALHRSAKPARRPLRWGPALALAGAFSVALLVVARNGAPFLANSDEEGPQPIEKSGQSVMSAAAPPAMDGAMPNRPVVRPSMEKSVAQVPMAKTLNLDLNVADVAEAQRTAEKLANQSGGVVLARGLVKRTEGGNSATLSLLIPERRLESAMAQLRELGSLSEESRLDQLSSPSETRTAAPRKGEMGSLKFRESVPMATVRISLTEKRPAHPGAGTAGWLDGTLGSAMSSLLAVARLLGGALIYALVFAPIWLPIAVLLRWIGSRQQLAA